MLVNYIDMETRSAKVSFKKIRCENDCLKIDYKIESFLYILHVTNTPEYL